MVPDTFSTERLHAERMSEAHFGELRVMQQDVLMMAMIGGVRDEASTAAYLERHVVHWSEHGFGFWMLRDRATDASAGLAGLRCLRLDDIDEVEVGYGFLPAFWGRGLATEIAMACVDHAFDRLQLPSLVALTKDSNVASQQVLRKAGLTYDRDVTHEGKTSMLFRGSPAGMTP
jgi:RimJ/RimL family protein N-acetyltransferase